MYMTHRHRQKYDKYIMLMAYEIKRRRVIGKSRSRALLENISALNIYLQAVPVNIEH